MHRLPMKIGLVLAVALSGMLCVSVFAYLNEPDAFRGIKWGTLIEKVPDMELSLDGGDLKAYTRKHDKMVLEGSELTGIHYVFYKEQFYCVRIEFKGLSNFQRIRDVFFKTYGEPGGQQYYETHFAWTGDKASITLDYDESTELGEVGYKYMPIDLQVAEDEKNHAEKDAG
jgi:hypothetical protein